MCSPVFTTTSQSKLRASPSYGIVEQVNTHTSWFMSCNFCPTQKLVWSTGFQQLSTKSPANQEGQLFPSLPQPQRHCLDHWCQTGCYATSVSPSDPIATPYCPTTTLQLNQVAQSSFKQFNNCHTIMLLKFHTLTISSFVSYIVPPLLKLKANIINAHLAGIH